MNNKDTKCTVCGGLTIPGGVTSCFGDEELAALFHDTLCTNCSEWRIAYVHKEIMRINKFGYSQFRAVRE